MPDNVNHPTHYTGFSNGSEVIDITESLTFNGGNAVKYLSRACRVDGGNKGAILEDLRKAEWYVQREIARMRKPSAAEYKAQVALDQGEPYLATATHLAVKWLSPADECQVAPDWLLKDEFDWANPNEPYQYLKQYAHHEGGWEYMQCNAYGETRPVTAKNRLKHILITWPITLVKQKEKK